jgi:predicted ATPase
MNAYYKNAGFLSDLVLAFEELFQNIYYLGPLRDYPRRSYTWAGHQPQDVGQKGELAIPALLASRTFEKITRGQDQRQQSIEECVAQWLRELGIIQDFKLQPIARNRQEYEVLVRRTPNAAEVLITDVGFGVSQILPVLVLCYYVPKGSTIIFEQPEIHLHPSVQAGLADVFIDAIKTRNIQIILESHSEHLLHRLQRRIAEEKLSPSDTALYFCQIDDRGNSHLLPLDIDSFGNINNHSQIFLGNDMSDLQAMAEATKQRQEKAEAMEATATDPSPEKVNME